MIHFKVIRASRLLLGLVIVVLLAVLVLLATRWMAQRQSPPVKGSASLVEAHVDDEVKTAQVFLLPYIVPF